MNSANDYHEQCSQLTSVSESAQWLVLVSIGLGVFVFSIDVSVIYILLPTLVETFHTSFTVIQWVTLSYVLVITISTIGAGRLGDIFSKKWLYMGGLFIFTLGSLLCGLAPTVVFLIGFRALQGLGAALISALSAAIVTEIFVASRRGLALGTVGAISTLGVILGPTLGGLLIGLGNWRLIFFVNVPICIITGLIVFYTVPSSTSYKKQHSFDVSGAIIIALTLSCFALSMTLGQLEGFNSSIFLLLLIITVVLFAIFVRVESNSLEPMLDLEIFRTLKFSLSILASWMMYTVMAGVIFILPFFLELIRDYSAQEVGLLISVIPMSVALMEPISGSLSDRLGWSISIVGLVIMVGGCLAIATLDTNLTPMSYIFCAVPLGCGMGIFLPPNNTIIMSNVPQEHLGVASALLSLCRVLGHMVGVPLLGSFFVTFSHIHDDFVLDFDAVNSEIANASVETLVFAEHLTFYIAACILMIAVMLLIYGTLKGDKQTRVSR